MYAKWLLRYNDSMSAPILAVSTPPGGHLLAELRTLGWSPYGVGLPAVDGAVVLNETRFEISNHERVFFDAEEGSPVSPDGWWDAVSRFADQCIVAVVEDGVLDSDVEDAASALIALQGTGLAVSALLPVEHR